MLNFVSSHQAIGRPFLLAYFDQDSDNVEIEIFR